MRKTKLEKHWQKKAEQYRNYANQLKSELYLARSRLLDISVGLVPSDIATNAWPLSTKLQYSAGELLKNRGIAKEPEGFFYP